MARDHGIYDGEDALMVCGDCIFNENIYDFGACGNGKYEPTYSDDAPPPARKVLNENGQERYVCFPVNGLYVDSGGRYWVAVAPNVVNPNHSKAKSNTDIDVSEMFPGTKMDIMVQCEKKGEHYGEIFYIPTVVGDAKEHSYPDGLYQTGIPFNEERVVDIESAGNTVEFIGSDIQEKVYRDGESAKSCVNVTNNYRIIEIIVYDGVYNYE